MCIFAGDIWSDGAISLFGILGYSISSTWKYSEFLVAAIPFSAVSHTGKQIMRSTKQALADACIGEFDESVSPKTDTVFDNVHASTSDSASNMKSGWTDVEGHECVDHMLALSVLNAFLKNFDAIHKVYKKIKGMTSHWNHSLLGQKLLASIQHEKNFRVCKPQQDNVTRAGWSGASFFCNGSLSSRSLSRLMT